MERNVICIHCEREFRPAPDKPGRVNECPRCAVETVERAAGVMAWEGKHTPVLLLTDAATAKQFAARNRRAASAPLSCLAPANVDGMGDSKKGSGSEAGAIYHTRMGEKRQVR